MNDLTDSLVEFDSHDGVFCPSVNPGAVAELSDPASGCAVLASRVHQPVIYGDAHHRTLVTFHGLQRYNRLKL